MPSGQTTGDGVGLAVGVDVGLAVGVDVGDVVGDVVGVGDCGVCCDGVTAPAQPANNRPSPKAASTPFMDR
jgi:hypothetical protein